MMKLIGRCGQQADACVMTLTEFQGGACEAQAILKRCHQTMRKPTDGYERAQPVSCWMGRR